MILVIDNYDSFTFNLVQFLGELGADLQVYRNDQLTVDQIKEMDPEKIIISPGPCTPNEAGISLDVIRHLGPTRPVLGVCLGHQAIGQAYGGTVRRAPYLMHGKVSRVRHRGDGLFAGLPDPMTATRYHSLIVDRDSLPSDLEVTAETEDGLIMGLKHKKHPVYGVQFHPESILTEGGKQLLGNFLALRAS
ncbi:MAG TPA: aminodeoxychorismate/anthranilate synthase component II [Symbiobacteriaceae bacterium]|nr:aminodeoxychorismate/anthranilate synthase component II [Symbiobacteriaceae bacterium]